MMGMIGVISAMVCAKGELEKLGNMRIAREMDERKRLEFINTNVHCIKRSTYEAGPPRKCGYCATTTNNTRQTNCCNCAAPLP